MRAATIQDSKFGNAEQRRLKMSEGGSSLAYDGYTFSLKFCEHDSVYTFCRFRKDKDRFALLKHFYETGVCQTCAVVQTRLTGCLYVLLVVGRG